jgi:hypothetical protein
MASKPGYQSILRPILAVFGSIFLFAYLTIALISQDPLWFLGRAVVPDPLQILIRVDGQEIVLTSSSVEYAELVSGVRASLSSFENWAPGSVGLSPPTLAEFQERGVILELYFAEPVNFRLPFNDGRPTALLIPIEGRYAGEGYVFRGKHGKWWAGQLVMKNPEPLLEALRRLNFR